MMKTKILSFIDFEKVNTLLEGFNQSTGFVTAILDLEGNILSKSGWRSICTQFHRTNPETSKRCTISDTYLAMQMAKGEKYHFYKCLNGLIDVAVPIIIKGEHIANLFSGQFFFEKPDVTFFQKQADHYKFNESTYLNALKNVPVISEEKVKVIMDFLLNMTYLISDMTLQKMALMELNDALRINEERYRLVLENSMDAILLTSPDGRILSANPAACIMFQRCEDEIIEVGRNGLVNVNDPRSDAIIEERNRTGKAKGELLMIRKDGTNFPAELSTSVFTDERGNLCSSVIIRDITERKITEAQLIVAKEKAEESDRLKSAFLQNMSHEIRTPMNAIMGFTDLLVENYNNKPKLEKFSEIINQRCDDLLAIINDILDIAKIESGQIKVNAESCDLKELFGELTIFFKEYQKRIGKQQIEFSLNIHCANSNQIIEIDKGKLKQIFINLLSNAFKFTSTGKIEGGCKLDENQDLVFYVSDTGIGIPKDKQKMVFERFAQVDHGPSRIYGGTGLGLSIVNGLVNLMGGKIFLESELDKGSTFYFKLPYKNSAASHNNTAILDRKEDYRFLNETILIVEDDIYNTEYIKEILSELGLKLLYTSYGNEAIYMTQQHHPNLVLMDIRLPDMTGYEAIKEIKKHNPDMKIIAQTAYASKEDQQKAINVGCVDYISKPLKRSLLLSLINEHLSK